MADALKLRGRFGELETRRAGDRVLQVPQSPSPQVSISSPSPRQFSRLPSGQSPIVDIQRGLESDLSAEWWVVRITFLLVSALVFSSIFTARSILRGFK